MNAFYECPWRPLTFLGPIKQMCHECQLVSLFPSLQLIQTISAIDKDDPLGGQKFFFSLAAVNPNFTVQDNEGMTHGELRM